MSLEHRIGNKCSRDASSTEKATVETLDGLLGRFNRVELDIYFALRNKHGQLQLSGKDKSIPESPSQP